MKLNQLFNAVPYQKIQQHLHKELHAIKKLNRDDLDLANAGQWPSSIKLFSLTLIVLGLVSFSHWLIINSYKEDLAAAQTKQARLIEDYGRNVFQAANLVAYQQQILTMETAFNSLVNSLTAAHEVPKLLDAIQQEANQQNLEVVSIKMQPLKQHNFYTQIPFEIKIKGNFHQLATFIAGISNLNHLITLHDFTLVPNAPNSVELVLTLEAQTYRYEQQAQAKVSP